MAKAKVISSIKFKVKPKKNNKGIHAKTKMSKCKTSKNYFKKSKGQG
jgi:hypothetical protein